MEFLITLTTWHFISLFAFGIGAEVVKKIVKEYLLPKAQERFSLFLPAFVIIVGVVLALIFPVAAEVILFGATGSILFYDTVTKVVKRMIRNLGDTSKQNHQ